MVLLRAVSFVICSAFILLAPAYPELFDEKHELRAVPDWQMFSMASLNVYEIRFETGEGGERHELDRFAALGFDASGKAPRSVRSIASTEQAWSLARKLCRAGHAPLYMRLRDAKLDGWKVIEAGKTDVCGRLASNGRPRGAR
jgi:hypothetical protein